MNGYDELVKVAGEHRLTNAHWGTSGIWGVDPRGRVTCVTYDRKYAARAAREAAERTAEIAGEGPADPHTRVKPHVRPISRISPIASSVSARNNSAETAQKISNRNARRTGGRRRRHSTPAARQAAYRARKKTELAA